MNESLCFRRNFYLMPLVQFFFFKYGRYKCEWEVLIAFQKDYYFLVVTMILGKLVYVKLNYTNY